MELKNGLIQMMLICYTVRYIFYKYFLYQNNSVINKHFDKIYKKSIKIKIDCQEIIVKPTKITSIKNKIVTTNLSRIDETETKLNGWMDGS